jgi:serine protease AprX
MRTLILSLLLWVLSPLAYSKALIDPNVLARLHHPTHVDGKTDAIPLLIFLKSTAMVSPFVADIKTSFSDVQAFRFMPVVAAFMPRNYTLLNTLANHPAAAQISLNPAGHEEMEVSAQSILLRPSDAYPVINNWWDAGYFGQHGVLGLIDSGVDVEHPGLSHKNIIVRKEPDANDEKYKNGVRTAHATGVACIYSGMGSGSFLNELGLAHELPTILSGLAGEDDRDKGHAFLTLNTLDWMLTRAGVRPTVINYSFGNGSVSCPTCNDWSGLARVVDYVVNHEHILWVKSAGNQGYITPRTKGPFSSTMTVPADNYNGLTVANMNPTLLHDGSMMPMPDRVKHTIRYTSSRGPTLIGRKKPDISAPGNDTRTCAPDPSIYPLNYSKAMDFKDGYRLMGGTSSAAPHVGAAALLLQEAGIPHPIAVKALLINSADAWTDNGKPSPDDPKFTYTGGHYPVMGSEWNPTYGWGYINMQNAYEERLTLVEDVLTPDNPTKEYDLVLPVGGKVTLVHERRVGYQFDGSEWRLSHLSLELYDAKTEQLITLDDSPIDTVHQVANCKKHKAHEPRCSSDTLTAHVKVRVKLLDASLDGSFDEPFALVSSVFTENFPK